MHLWEWQMYQSLPQAKEEDIMGEEIGVLVSQGAGGSFLNSSSCTFPGNTENCYNSLKAVFKNPTALKGEGWLEVTSAHCLPV